MSSSPSPSPGPPVAHFPQTRWSLVLDAQEDDPAALAELCRAYWYPLYCFARRLVPTAEDAQDLTQAFFEKLLQRQSLKLARADRGKLRTFLLAGLRNLSAESYRRSQAHKRGGGAVVLEFDAMEAEQRYALEPRDHLSPEREFDRAWARQLLAAALARLGETYQAAGRGELFAALQCHLSSGDTAEYVAVAARLGITPPAVRFAAFKLRERYRALLRGMIKETVTSEAEVEEEMAHLRGLFEA